VREGHMAAGNDRDYARKAWFHCACCPPNVMRTLASLEHYVVLSSAERVLVHQYIPGVYRASVGDGEASLRLETEYPWQGRVRIAVESAPGGRWGLSARVPHWAEGTSGAVNGEPVQAAVQDGWLTVEREWSAGDELVLDVPLEVRFTRADPRVDADRGAVALERGPLVYCLEGVDHPGHRLDDVVIDTEVAPVTAEDPDLLGGIATIRATGQRRSRPDSGWWPYTSATASSGSEVPSEAETGAQPGAEPATLTLTAVPYFVWGNRDEGAMRVWLPAD
jgi:DUF1680 family protein